MKNKIIGILVSMLLFATVFSVAGTNNLKDNINPQTTSTDVDWWPMFQHDASHSGYSLSTGPEIGNTLWSWSKNSISYTHTLASPIVVDDKIIVPIVGNNRNDYVYCFDAALCNNFTSDKSAHSTKSSVTTSPYTYFFPLC